MSACTLEQLVARVATLPHLPGTAHRLVSVVSDPGSTLQQIVEAIRYDQSLTAEVLRLCNSAYYGLERKVESIDDAVKLLGTVKVFQLVMAAHTRSILVHPQEGYGLEAGKLWQHAVSVAIATQPLARHMKLNQSGMLFTAGLLHDVGKIVLNEFVSQEYSEIQRVVSERKCTFAEAEHAVLGFTHPEVGGQLAETWSLPESIVKCIRYHHEPELVTPPNPLVDAIHLADSISMLLGIGIGDDGLSYRGSADVLERHGLHASDLEVMGVEVIAELRSVEDLFSSKQ